MSNAKSDTNTAEIAAALEAASAANAAAMHSLREQAKTVVEQLQRDVLRLLEQTQQQQPDARVTQQSENGPSSAKERDVADAARDTDAGASPDIAELVRTELAALDIPKLVKDEVEAQLRTVGNLLHDRLKAAPQPGLRKIAPLLARGRS